MPTTSKSATATAAEAKLFQIILMNLEHKPSVDWDFIAQACDYKDSKSAQERFRQIRIRLKAREYADTKRSPMPLKEAGKRRSAASEMTPSPSPKTPKLDGTSARKVIHTTWTPKNLADTGKDKRPKAPSDFNVGKHDGSTVNKDLGGTKVSTVSQRTPTPQGSDDDDAYKEELEDWSSLDDFEEGDGGSVFSEV